MIWSSSKSQQQTNTICLNNWTHHPMCGGKKAESMVWGCFTAIGPGRVAVINRKSEFQSLSRNLCLIYIYNQFIQKSRWYVYVYVKKYVIQRITYFFLRLYREYWMSDFKNSCLNLSCGSPQNVIRRYTAQQRFWLVIQLKALTGTLQQFLQCDVIVK